MPTTMNIWVFGSRFTMAMCNGISLPVAVGCSSNIKKKNKIRDGKITTKANIIALFVNYLKQYKQNNDQQTTRCQPKLHFAFFICNKWHPISTMFTFISNIFYPLFSCVFLPSIFQRCYKMILAQSFLRLMWAYGQCRLFEAIHRIIFGE